NETRPSVSLTRHGYVPALEVSHRGGDCEPNTGHPRETLQEAIGAAKEMESRWHFDMSWNDIVDVNLITPVRSIFGRAGSRAAVVSGQRCQCA
ncbi:hypothetical protein K6Y73_40685, partial [Burkholderia cenocepacia]|nr:hypothetical protein [Burkholderia cenocepacia]